MLLLGCLRRPESHSYPVKSRGITPDEFLPNAAQATSLPMIRGSEWLLLIYFSFMAAVAPWFQSRPSLGVKPFLQAIVIFCIIGSVAWLQPRIPGYLVSWFRDWLPAGLLLVAFRELDWFTPASYPNRFEPGWLALDHLLLSEQHLGATIELAGKLLPGYLELCYFLVYFVGLFGVGVLWLTDHRERVNNFLLIYLSGALLTYVFVPWFPSVPPRFFAPQMDLPRINTIFRELNLWVLNQGTIHAGVFPSAHVASAFSAAWGLLLTLPERRRYGRGMLVFAFSVSLATVYGRYHYAADAVAGFVVSLVALGGITALKRLDPRWRQGGWPAAEVELPTPRAARPGVDS
jgi:membrane-associated phospholipid phosphatase